MTWCSMVSSLRHYFLATFYAFSGQPSRLYRNANT
jgi:hypothetical protein